MPKCRVGHGLKCSEVQSPPRSITVNKKPPPRLPLPHLAELRGLGARHNNCDDSSYEYDDGEDSDLKLTQDGNFFTSDSLGRLEALRGDESETSSMRAEIYSYPDMENVEPYQWDDTDRRPTSTQDAGQLTKNAAFLFGAGSWQTLTPSSDSIFSWRLPISLDDFDIFDGTEHTLADVPSKAPSPSIAIEAPVISAWRHNENVLVARSISDSADSSGPGLTEDGSRDSDSVCLSDHPQPDPAQDRNASWPLRGIVPEPPRRVLSPSPLPPERYEFPEMRNPYDHNLSLMFIDPSMYFDPSLIDLDNSWSGNTSLHSVPPPIISDKPHTDHGDGEPLTAGLGQRTDTNSVVQDIPDSFNMMEYDRGPSNGGYEVDISGADLSGAHLSGADRSSISCLGAEDELQEEIDFVVDTGEGVEHYDDDDDDDVDSSDIGFFDSESESVWLSDYSETVPVFEMDHPFFRIQEDVVTEALARFEEHSATSRSHSDWTALGQGSVQCRPSGENQAVGASAPANSPSQGGASGGDGLGNNTPEKRRSVGGGGGEGDDTGENGPGEGPPRKRTRLSKRQAGRILSLACPFAKKDPVKHRGCYAYILRRSQDVKQHLSRDHQLPIYCGCCKDTFKTEEERDRHNEEVGCAPRKDIVHEGVTRAQKDQLGSRVNARMSLEEQWFSIFDILFPGHMPRPVSAYVNPSLTVELECFQDLMAGEGIDIIQEALNQHGLQITSINNEDQNISALQRVALTEGMRRIAQRWTDRTMITNSPTGNMAGVDSSGTSVTSRNRASSEFSRTSSDTLVDTRRSSGRGPSQLMASQLIVLREEGESTSHQGHGGRDITASGEGTNPRDITPQHMNTQDMTIFPFQVGREEEMVLSLQNVQVSEAQYADNSVQRGIGHSVGGMQNDRGSQVLRQNEESMFYGGELGLGTEENDTEFSKLWRDLHSQKVQGFSHE